MPINIAETVIGGASNLCGSYLTNPIWTAILIILIIAIILVWNYWQYCSVGSHVATLIYIFATTVIVLIAHSEAIRAIYDDKYKNKASEELMQSLTNQREHELVSNLIGVRTNPVLPKPNIVGMHQQQPQPQPAAQLAAQPQAQSQPSQQASAISMV